MKRSLLYGPRRPPRRRRQGSQGEDMWALRNRGDLLVDPSILLSESGLTWVSEDPAAREVMVVSAAFYDALAYDPERLAGFTRGADLDALPDRRERLLGLLERVPRFSAEGVELPPRRQEVTYALLRLDDPSARIYADAWAYLQSRSWMIAAARRTLDAFRDAGALIVEDGRRLRDEMIASVVRQGNVPDVITPGFLARVGAKWLVAGGAGALAGSLVAPVVGPLGTALAGSAVGRFSTPFVKAFDG